MGKIQQTSDRTYKQTRELEIALEILQCCCHASHDFQFAHVVSGFKDVEIAGANSKIALATFHSPMHALKFVRNQRKHPTMMSNKLWAAENRSKNERNRCKILSKAKKFMIELGGHSPKDVVVSYKMFRVITRVNGKLIPTASVSEDLVVEWLNEAVPDTSVREALDGFIGDME